MLLFRIYENLHDWMVENDFVEEVSEEVTDVKFVKVSTEEAPELAEKFSIMYIPTLVLMENGTVVNKSTGFLQKEQILELLNTKN